MGAFLAPLSVPMTAMMSTLTRATCTMTNMVTTIMMTTTTRNGRSRPRARKKDTASMISTTITIMAMAATGMEGMAMAAMESSAVTEDMAMVANTGATEVSTVACLDLVDTAPVVMEARV